MEDSYGTSLIGVMDHLWFNKIVLFSQPNSKPLTKLSCTTQSYTTHSSMASILEDETLALTSSSSFTPLLDSFGGNGEDIEKDQAEFEERPTRLSAKMRTQSYSSLPSSRKRSRSHGHTSPATRLQKTMSCKTHWELEEEEIKGFVDLGFIFDAENTCPRMMSVVPGLQRIGGCHKNNGGEKEGDLVLRPYLSEAWLVRRPDSPLINLRVPEVSTVADMKKLLKFWARTVASEGS